jgi:MFS superfamily sulfate permease-like transporter
MTTVITVTISLLIGAFIGIILAAFLAMGNDSAKPASKSFAEWVNLKFYLVERYFGLRHS